MKTTKDFNPPLQSKAIRSVSNYKILLKNEQRKALSKKKVSSLQKEILQQDHIIKIMEDNFPSYFNVPIDNI
tara:strand:+ start:9110 stop:9325 length:216 start_codon:yes stop_codon:yes gene_type:complete